MYSTELIRKFPDTPDKQILFVVYNKEMMMEAKALIGTIHGVDYLEKHVKVVPFTEQQEDLDLTQYSVYIDPTVMKYKQSWSN